MSRSLASFLAAVAPRLERAIAATATAKPRFETSEILRRTVHVPMRDGTRLATEVYLPPTSRASSIAMRTPYGRANERITPTLLAFACHGYAVIAQDCRGTGDSEPQVWDYYMYETEDSCDFIDWVTTQHWFDGFIGACGGSYVGQMQWCMGMHSQMSTIVPEVSGLGIATNTVHLYMAINAYARSVGKGAGKTTTHYTDLERMILDETLVGGYFNEPLYHPLPSALLEQYPQLAALTPSQARRFLWQEYCAMSCARRAAFVRKAFGTTQVSILEVESLSDLFGPEIAHDSLTVPCTSRADMCHSLRAPPLMITGWYDWALNDALATYVSIKREARYDVGERARLIVTPAAHNMPGYREDADRHEELLHNHRTPYLVSVLLRWYAAVREGTVDDWPAVIYYLMGANEWRTATDWPPPDTQPLRLYLGADNALSPVAPAETAAHDRYVYDPRNPTPTTGGSILSSVLVPGSADISETHRRSDVLVYTSVALEQDLDVVGPLQLVLYAASSARDTDFSARLSDVLPDGRALQLQSGILRARYRRGQPQLLEPGEVCRFEIDMWATANRFKRGHRLRLDICSADFPRFDRNANRGGEPGAPLPATQRIYRDTRYPSHLVISTLGVTNPWAR